MNDAALLKTDLEIVENCFSSQFLKLHVTNAYVVVKN